MTDHEQESESSSRPTKRIRLEHEGNPVIKPEEFNTDEFLSEQHTLPGVMSETLVTSRYLSNKGKAKEETEEPALVFSGEAASSGVYYHIDNQQGSSSNSYFPSSSEEQSSLPFGDGHGDDDEIIFTGRRSPDPVAGPSRIRHRSDKEAITVDLTASPLEPNHPPVESPKPAGKEMLADYPCPICFSPPKNATLTACGHVMCGECLFVAVKANVRRAFGNANAAEANTPRCPVCRAELKGWDGKGAGVIPLYVRMVSPT